jgi:hypothetical protein
MPGHHVPIEQADTPVRVERMGGVSWRFVAVIGLVAGLIAIAIAKPWESPRVPLPGDWASAIANASPDAPDPTSAAAPNDPELDAAVMRKLCDAPPQWRLVTMEATALGNSRTMYGATAAEASGPADRSIPTAHLSAIHLYAIGLCQPNAAGLRSAVRPLEGITLWKVPPRGAPARVVGFSTLDQELFSLGEGYFGPPPAEPGSAQPTASPPVWQPGRYVFEIDRGGDNGQALWLALDFAAARQLPATLTPSPMPLSSPGNGAGTASSGRPLDY